MAPTTVHSWLALATLALHVAVVARLMYLEQERLPFGPEDPPLIILAETSLALLVIDGIYLSGGLHMTTRIAHHVAALTPVAINLLFVFAANHSVSIAKGRRFLRYTLALFVIDSVLIFLAYWVSSGAAFGWWDLPDQWTNQVRR